MCPFLEMPNGSLNPPVFTPINVYLITLQVERTRHIMPVVLQVSCLRPPLSLHHIH